MYTDTHNKYFELDQEICDATDLISAITLLIDICKKQTNVPSYALCYENDVFKLDVRPRLCDCTYEAKIEEWKEANTHDKTCIQIIAEKRLKSYIESQPLPSTLQEYTIWITDINKQHDKILAKLEEEFGMQKIGVFSCTCDYNERLFYFKNSLGDHLPTCRLNTPDFIYKSEDLKLFWLYRPLNLAYTNKPKTKDELLDIFLTAIKSVKGD